MSCLASVATSALARYAKSRYACWSFMKSKSKGPRWLLWPVSVLTTANPRISAGVSPAAFRPSGGITVPFPPPPPCIRKSPFHLLGHGERKVDAKLLAANSGAAIDHALDPAIGRKRCAVTGPHGFGSVVPAAIGAALEISTPGALKCIRSPHETCLLGPRAWTQAEHGPQDGPPQSRVHVVLTFLGAAPPIIADLIGRPAHVIRRHVPVRDGRLGCHYFTNSPLVIHHARSYSCFSLPILPRRYASISVLPACLAQSAGVACQRISFKSNLAPRSTRSRTTSSWPAPAA